MRAPYIGVIGGLHNVFFKQLIRLHFPPFSSPFFRRWFTTCDSTFTDSEGPVDGGGGVKRGGFPIWTCPSFLVCFCHFCHFFVFLSFLGLSRFSRIFPIFLGIFLFGPWPLSRPVNFLKSGYEEQSRKGPCNTIRTCPEKVGTPPFGNPPVYLLPRFHLCFAEPCLFYDPANPLQPPAL